MKQQYAKIRVIFKRRVFVMEYVVRFSWDEEAQVWIATSDDIPGLVLESGSFDALAERVRFAVPELLELNKLTPALNLLYLSEKREKLAA